MQKEIMQSSRWARLKATAGCMTMVNFDGVVDGSPEHQAWLDKLTVLERFNGLVFAQERVAANDEWREAA